MSARSGRPRSRSRESNVRNRILDSAIYVFGKHGFKKTTVEDLAKVAGLSKPGLYLHFAGKNEIYVAAIERYLEQGLDLAEKALRSDGTTQQRLLATLESWFGRHMDVFSDDAFDVFTVGNQLTEEISVAYQMKFKKLLITALKDSSVPPISPRQRADIIETLFVCGLSWKEYGLSRLQFSERLEICVRACLPERTGR